MNNEKHFNADQLDSILNDYSTVSGIRLDLIMADDAKNSSPCFRNCNAEPCTFSLHKPKGVFCKSLYLCPLGLFHICLPVLLAPNEEKKYIFSEPISIEPTSTPTLLVRSPGNLVKTVHLLQLLLNCNICKSNTVVSMIDQLKFAQKENNPKLAKEVFDGFLIAILQETGTDMTDAKSKTLDFIILMLELMEDHNALPLYQFSLESIVKDVINTNTISDLMTLINNLETIFLQTIFAEHALHHSELVEKAVAYLKEAYSTKITQTQVANMVYLSPTYFSKIFNIITGKSFSQLLNEIRIEKAKELLQNPDINIDVIFHQVGFENQIYFGRVFKKETGMTPKNYRNKYLGRL